MNKKVINSNTEEKVKPVDIVDSKENIKADTSIGNDVQDVQDINFDTIRKKRFRVDGDNNRILELNTSDLNVLPRLEESYPKLNTLCAKASTLQIDIDEDGDDITNKEGITALSSTLKEIDTGMRDLIDYIFDSDVSEKCAPYGSMFDPINGQFRFEHVLDKLTSLYETDYKKEFEAIRNRVRKHTDKYNGRR